MDKRRLRLYERSKLRYYYAIICCDSAGGLRGLRAFCRSKGALGCRQSLQLTQACGGHGVRNASLGREPCKALPPHLAL